MSQTRDWKTYDDFICGAATDRLPPSDDLVGQTLKVLSPGAPALQLSFISPDQVVWRSDGQSGAEFCEAIEVTPDVFFIDLTFMERPREALTVIVDLATRRTLQIRFIVRDEDIPGEPRVALIFNPGRLEGGTVKGEEPALANDPIGSPTFDGHGELDLADVYRFAGDQYVLARRGSKAAGASVAFLDFNEQRWTGKVLEIDAGGRVSSRPAGGFIDKDPTSCPSEASPA